MMQMCNFNLEEYTDLYLAFEESMRDILYSGKKASKDLFFMLSVSLKMGTNWNIISQMFRLRLTGVQKKLELLPPDLHLTTFSSIVLKTRETKCNF